MKLTPRLIAIGAAVLLVVVILIWGPAMCRSLFTAKQDARNARGQAGAAIQSGSEATNTLGNVIELDAYIDAQVQGGIDAIRKAPEGQRGAAAQRVACGMRSYQHDERCAGLRAPGAAGPAGGR